MSETPQAASAFRHIGLTVSDLARSVRFYRDYLGFKPFAEYPARSGAFYSTLVGVENPSIDIMLLQLPDGTRLELLCYTSHPVEQGQPARATQPGRPHFALTVQNLNALYQQREAFGCVFKSAPLRSPDGVLVAYCHDPDGTILELVELPAAQ